MFRASSADHKMATYHDYKGAKEDIAALIKDTKSNPVMIRLAWHDSGTFDASVTGPWPKAGGANGSIRFPTELNHGANAGLAKIVAMLEPIKAKYPTVSYADIFQLASALGVELAGGPKIPLRLGRIDVPEESQCPAEGNLPAGAAPWPKSAESAAAHLRDVFYRMGFNDQEIVALSGAHTLGRAYKSRSGLGAESTKYTKDGPGTLGGSSWTPDWLKFNNSYYKHVMEKGDADLLVLATDSALFEDPAFRPFAEKYAADEKAFFADYVKAHVKLSELGSKFVEGAPIYLD